MSGHVVLVGLSGSGKSTVGRLLAAAWRCPFYDTDTLLAARARRPVPDLLRADERGFRRLEEDVVREVCARPAGVIATGGGAVLSSRNRVALRDGNTVVWLRAPAATLAARLRGGEERPLLAGDPVARLAVLAAEREPLYAACAHVTMETERLAAEEVARRVQGVVEVGIR